MSEEEVRVEFFGDTLMLGELLTDQSWATYSINTKWYCFTAQLSLIERGRIVVWNLAFANPILSRDGTCERLTPESPSASGLQRCVKSEAGHRRNLHWKPVLRAAI